LKRLRADNFQLGIALPAEYPAYIIIDRPGFTLRLYDHLRLAHTYPIAVGRAGLETPPGLHHILDNQVKPAWHVPHSSWAGSLAGKVIPPGPTIAWSPAGWPSTTRAMASTEPTSQGRSAQPPHMAVSACWCPM
jgi:hypothetical protein